MTTKFSIGQTVYYIWHYFKEPMFLETVVSKINIEISKDGDTIKQTNAYIVDIHGQETKFYETDLFETEEEAKQATQSDLYKPTHQL